MHSRIVYSTVPLSSSPKPLWPLAHLRTTTTPHTTCCAVPYSSSRQQPSTGTATDHHQQNTMHYCPGNPAGGTILQLGQLATPNSLQDAWLQDILPACSSAWEALLMHACNNSSNNSSLLLATASSPAEDDEPCCCLQQQGEHIEQFLLQLDALLGTCQQLLLMTALLKDRHQQQAWRTASTAVFVQVRSLEQELCSDVQLQQGLLACMAWLEQQEQQETQRARQSQDSADEVPPSWPGHDGRQILTSLAQGLLRHMQLESLTPLTVAAAAVQRCSSSSSQQAQVLSLAEQQALMSGLLAEQKVLVNNMQAVLLDPAAAPMVELDPESAAVVLEPLQANLTAAAAAAGVGMGSSPAAEASTAAAAAAQDTDGVTELRLDLQLVQQLLQLHPDSAVRAEVHSAGLLQRLDVLLSQWGQLAEVRRKIGRMHGLDSYADFVLQHTLFKDPAVAGAFCQQLATALQPGACKAAARLQQGLGHGSDDSSRTAADSISGSDLPRLLYKEWASILSQQELDELQPYLQLPGVLSGLDALLQLMLGLRLTARQPLPGEVWADRVLVLELRQLSSPATPTQTQSSSYNDTDSTRGTANNPTPSTAAGALLGTVYVDLTAGYAAQLLLYGQGHPFLGCTGPQGLLQQQQQQPQQNNEPASDGVMRGTNQQHTEPLGSSTSSSHTDSSGCGKPAVALGLQSGGALSGTTYDQVALGLWELCHEMGHAVNFILSSSSSSNSYDSHTETGGAAGSAMQATQGQCLYHTHASWLPFELLELPSTLFEVLVMDPLTLQLLCTHQHTGEALPAELASSLARFMQATHYNPAVYQSMVLTMLYDLEMSAISSRQLGQHAAHHLWRTIMQDLSAMQGMQLLLQQVFTVPRLLVSSCQGFGYAVAWCLARALQPALLLHISNAAAEQMQLPLPDQQERKVEQCQQQWLQLLRAGGSLSDTRILVSQLVMLEQHCTCAGESPLASSLQQQGLWPLQQQNENVQQQHEAQLFAACLSYCLDLVSKSL